METVEAFNLAELIVDDHSEDLTQKLRDQKNCPIWETKPLDPSEFKGIGLAAGKSGVLCAVFGCEKTVESAGLCQNHYRYWKRNGTEALNRWAKRVPRTREEAVALLQVRAIEYADAAENDEASDYQTNIDRAGKFLEEAALLFGDPAARRRYSLATGRQYMATRRASGTAPKTTYKNKDGKTRKEVFIETYGIEAWLKSRREVWERWKKNYIAKHGEQAYKDRVNKNGRAYWDRKKKKKLALLVQEDYNDIANGRD